MAKDLEGEYRPLLEACAFAARRTEASSARTAKRRTSATFFVPA